MVLVWVVPTADCKKIKDSRLEDEEADPDPTLLTVNLMPTALILANISTVASREYVVVLLCIVAPGEVVVSRFDDVMFLLRVSVAVYVETLRFDYRDWVTSCWQQCFELMACCFLSAVVALVMVVAGSRRTNTRMMRSDVVLVCGNAAF
ncbi:hypothetical protein F511_35470 [Dorcoceras hygrometricum]|uniref:Uncharacterized protein n=1 Tax=Dorcoceras hygrometricum TaxID=472368 RepID=A0A2Z7CCK9_9LAMI|nr:hypothetical protein F511_35470 [Dorcoceras hygrometricum]